MADIDKCVKSQPATIADFDIFYAAYPKKKGKHAALRRWKQMKRPPLAVLLAAIEAQKKSKQWLRDNGQYIPHPATWLHDGAWEDEVEEQKQAEHASRLAENTGADNVLAKAVEDAMHERAATEWNKIDREWGKLSSADKRQVFAEYTKETGFKAHIKPVQAWWWKAGRAEINANRQVSS